MLSEKQQEVLVNRVNKDVDLPFVSEDSEERLLEKAVNKVAPLVEPALRSFLPDSYIDCLKIALMEGVAIEEKRSRIQEILRGEIVEPLAQELNARCDVGLVPERLEGYVFKAISKKFVDELGTLHHFLCHVFVSLRGFPNVNHTVS